jgi:hypothetical protein
MAPSAQAGTEGNPWRVERSETQDWNWNGFVQKEQGGAWEKRAQHGRPDDDAAQAGARLTRACIHDRHKIQKRNAIPEKPLYAGKAVNTKTGAEIVVICSDVK